MHVRFVTLAAALIGTSAFAADSPKMPTQAASQSQPAPAEVVLASAADPVRPAAADQQVKTRTTTTTKPMRVARVTTCRCGGQEAESDGQPDE